MYLNYYLDAKNYKRLKQQKIDEMMIQKYNHLKCRRLM